MLKLRINRSNIVFFMTFPIITVSLRLYPYGQITVKVTTKSYSQYLSIPLQTGTKYPLCPAPIRNLPEVPEG